MDSAIPSDFSAEYKWREGSVPPPYHYEYIISIGPGARGEIVFFPDYPSDETPAWRETFEVSDEALSAFFGLIKEKEVLSTNWQEMENPLIGGELEWLKVTAGGTQVLVPSLLIEEQAAAISAVFQAIRSFVPESIWTDLMARREQYEQHYLDATG